MLLLLVGSGTTYVVLKDGVNFGDALLLLFLLSTLYYVYLRVYIKLLDCGPTRISIPSVPQGELPKKCGSVDIKIGDINIGGKRDQSIPLDSFNPVMCNRNIVNRPVEFVPYWGSDFPRDVRRGEDTFTSDFQKAVMDILKLAKECMESVDNKSSVNNIDGSGDKEAVNVHQDNKSEKDEPDYGKLINSVLSSVMPILEQTKKDINNQDPIDPDVLAFAGVDSKQEEPESDNLD